MTVRLARSALLLAAALAAGIAGAPARAAEFACGPDQCIERINEIVRRANQDLVVAKQVCEEQNGSQRCIYRGGLGPNIHVFFSPASPNVQVILIADGRGLSPAGCAYIAAVMEAFDTSLDADRRTQFYNKLVEEAVSSAEKGGQLQLVTDGLTYSLFTNERLTIVSIQGRNG
jgi:hypothetical protein